jgi:molybdenum cofactor cytidylyltransferase
VKVAAVVLAAGFSRRLGRPKQTAVLAGETLLARAIRIARSAGAAPVVVVLREALDRAVPQAEAVMSVCNMEAEEGMASSVRVGVRALETTDVAGALLMTCDQPLLSATHLKALCDDTERVTASAYNGRSGVPAYFPRRCFADLLALRGDAGARSLLQNAVTILNEELALDIDTENDLQRAEAVLRARQHSAA